LFPRNITTFHVVTTTFTRLASFELATTVRSERPVQIRTFPTPPSVHL
jgi:hypothetical protein